MAAAKADASYLGPGTSATTMDLPSHLPPATYHRNLTSEAMGSNSVSDMGERGLSQSSSGQDQFWITMSKEERYQPPPVVDWGPAGQPHQAEEGCSAAHQLIHGHPPSSTAVKPLSPVNNEVIDESVDEEEEEGEDGNVSDEGYRTHSSGCEGSPQSSISPSPKADPRKMDPKQQQQQQQQPSKSQVANPEAPDDGSNSNLMWLLDFKLDFFNDGSQQQQQPQQPQQTQVVHHQQLHQHHHHHHQHHHHQQPPQQLQHHPHHHQHHHQALNPHHHQLQTPDQHYLQSVPVVSSGPEPEQALEQEQQHVETAPTIDVETSTPEDGTVVANTTSMDKHDSDKRSRKPPYTYTELITQALKDKTALTVSGIYQWITDNFPYFKAEDDRWKNSVRHNLSMNPHFRKGDKSKHGAGHLWILAEYDEGAENSALSATDDLLGHEDEDETARAVRSILGQEAANQAKDQEARAVVAKNQRQSNSSNGQREINTRQRVAAAMAAEAARRPNTANKENCKEVGGKRRHHQTSLKVPEAPKTDGFNVQYIGKARPGTDLDPDGPGQAKRSMNHQPVVVHPGSVVATSAAAATIFSPMEQMEELDVVSAYCYDDDVASLEKALGIDLQDPNAKELLAK